MTVSCHLSSSNGLRIADGGGLMSTLIIMVMMKIFDAVGIISGGAPYEGGSIDTSLRESYFTQIESAEASRESQTHRELNCQRLRI